MLIFGYSFGSALRPVVSRRHSGAITGFTFVARIPLWLRHTQKSVYIRTHPSWKYIITAQNDQDLVHGVVLPESSV